MMSPKFWEYFLNIESDLARCSRYVEFAPANYGTYSNEFAQIIVTAASEVDAILRETCAIVDPQCRANNINEYFSIIAAAFPGFTQCGVDIRRNGLSIQPWLDWSAGQSPSWWGKGFTKLKHDRTNNFETASLSNALKAVGALFLTVLHFHHLPTKSALNVDINRGTQLFTPTNIHGYQGGARWFYGIPKMEGVQ